MLAVLVDEDLAGSVMSRSAIPRLPFSDEELTRSPAR
jgi:hypothetical protein